MPELVHVFHLTQLHKLHPIFSSVMRGRDSSIVSPPEIFGDH